VTVHCIEAAQAGKQCFCLLAFNREAVEWNASAQFLHEGLLSQKQFVNGGGMIASRTQYFIIRSFGFWERLIDTCSNRSVQKKFIFFAISKLAGSRNRRIPIK
jgi:hypothetical protein